MALSGADVLYKADKAKRLKGAIDSRIAEEQARQKALQSTPSRSNSSARRSSSRTVSPSKRQARAKEREKRTNDAAAEKGPDPSEFEPEITLDDEESRSLVGAPGSGAELAGGGTISVAINDKPPVEDDKEPNVKMELGDDGSAPLELPTDVRVKLRKLDKLESRYQDLLRSYRIAHARVQLIEPFETSLRENTPLTSISDPGALVEYLNQLNLKGDMVLDELKRVSTERDLFKQKLADAEKSTKEAWDEVANLRRLESKVAEPKVEDPQSNDASEPEKSPSVENQGTVSSPTAPSEPIPSATPISPESQPAEVRNAHDSAEELFSYDSELPRLESELRTRQEEIVELKAEVKTLKGDLAVARESTESMAQSLEDATRELNTLRDSKERHGSELQEQNITHENTTNDLKSKLHTAEHDLDALRSEKDAETRTATAELESRLQAANQMVEQLQSEREHEANTIKDYKQLQEEAAKLSSEISTLRSSSAHSDKRSETLNGIVKNLKEQLAKAESTKETLRSQIRETTDALEALRNSVAHSKSENEASQRKPAGAELIGTAHVSNGDELGRQEMVTTSEANKAISGKKKNKKKKKPSRSTPDQIDEGDVKAVEPALGIGSAEAPSQEPSLSAVSNSEIIKLQEELQSLRQKLVEKDTALERMYRKAKNEEDLQDEIEHLRDDLINIGQEHVAAKDRVKELLLEKGSLEQRVESLEKELAEVKANFASNEEEAEQAHKNLAAEFEDLSLKATALQTDLSAAQQLAASRFKDLTNLREVLQKAQPELTSLRSEVAGLKTTKEELGNKSAELKRLESRHQDLSSEMAGLKKTVAEKDSEIKTLNQKIAQETTTRLKVEDANSSIQVALQTTEGKRRETQESLMRITRDLARAQDEANASRARIRDLEQQVEKLTRDAEGLREEIELKIVQYVSAQSLMGSMRDQTAEMAMQMKEARERCESLDEELGDAHRLLGERSRESETMRKLLADTEGRTDSRIREMKDRLEAAIEERDRAEDEASTISRKRAREIDELKTKVRDVERSLKRAEDDKEELEALQKEWKRRREELEATAEQSSSEINHVRQAMAELRDALDESERQARELEKQKAELRQSAEETRQRFEKLQKSNKAMTDELRSLQNAKTKAMDSEAQSSRSSLESAPSRARLGSPAPKTKTNSAIAGDGSAAPGTGNMDFVYLKNVLLQFLEQRDKKHQMQLIPVLGMLLHFDRKDEQKWMAAITTK